MGAIAFSIFNYDTGILNSILQFLGMEKVKIPKLTLQPIVENAIQHGILHLQDRFAAKISVTARSQEDFVIIEIRYNGIGMTAEVLEDLKVRRIKPDKEHGVGINNVNERIKLYYGPLCGVCFESVENVGTCVSVKIKRE